MSVKRTKCKYCKTYYRDHQFEEDEDDACYSCQRHKDHIRMYEKIMRNTNPFINTQLGIRSRHYWADKLLSILKI